MPLPGGFPAFLEVIPMATALKVVGEQQGNQPPRRSISEAVTLGERETLEAVRDLIAAELDAGVAARDLASLTKRLRDIQQDIMALDKRDSELNVEDMADEPFSPATS